MLNKLRNLLPDTTPNSATAEFFGLPLPDKVKIICPRCKRRVRALKYSQHQAKKHSSTVLWVEWIEPFGPTNEAKFCRVTKAAAIAYHKAACEQQGHDPQFFDDEEMLRDFLTIHWAWIVKETKEGAIKKSMF